jgi:hypothetical protein
MLNRRQFLKTSALASLGAGIALPVRPLATRWATGKPSRIAITQATDNCFAHLEVAGDPHEIGRAIGETFGPSIKTALTRRQEWYKKLHDWARGDGSKLIEAMMAAAKKHTPAVVEELEGWAAGSGLDYFDLFVFNAKSEIEAFIDSRCGCAGCSTVVLKEGGRLLIFHNEDGHKAYQDLMFMVSLRPTDGPRVVGFTYPGVMEGNAPWINEHGIVMTTNYIPGEKVVPGIPRYFLDRTAMAARTLEDALLVVSHPERAYAYHHTVSSLVEKRSFSIEATPDKLVVKELEGLFYHTNHLVWPELEKEPQFQKYMKISSHPRYDSLTRSLGGRPLAELTPDAIIKALSSHDGKPYSVCRHPAEEATGATLGSAFFSAPPTGTPLTMTLRKNQPCLGKVTTYQV